MTQKSFTSVHIHISDTLYLIEWIAEVYSRVLSVIPQIER